MGRSEDEDTNTEIDFDKREGVDMQDEPITLEPIDDEIDDDADISLKKGTRGSNVQSTLDIDYRSKSLSDNDSHLLDELLENAKKRKEPENEESYQNDSGNTGDLGFAGRNIPTLNPIESDEPNSFVPETGLIDIEPVPDENEDQPVEIPPPDEYDEKPMNLDVKEQNEDHQTDTEDKPVPGSDENRDDLIADELSTERDEYGEESEEETMGEMDTADEMGPVDEERTADENELGDEDSTNENEDIDEIDSADENEIEDKSDTPDENEDQTKGTPTDELKGVREPDDDVRKVLAGGWVSDVRTAESSEEMSPKEEDAGTSIDEPEDPENDKGIEEPKDAEGPDDDEGSPDGIKSDDKAKGVKYEVDSQEEEEAPEEEVKKLMIDHVRPTSAMKEKEDTSFQGLISEFTTNLSKAVKLQPFKRLFGGSDEWEREREIFNPVLINIEEIIMLSSGIVLAAIFMTFVLSKDVWYANFSDFNAALLVMFSIIVIVGLVISYFSKSDNPRLQGSQEKKTVFSILGLISMGVSVIYLLVLQNSEGGVSLSFGILAAAGLYMFIISSQAMSKWEAYRFTPFFIGALILVLIPIHETFGVHDSDFSQLPLSPLNLTMIVSGASLTLLGIYLLRERSGYFGVWLFGIVILLLIPLHEFFDYVSQDAYETFDQTVGIIGAFFLVSGYLMFFYRYVQYTTMSDHIFMGNNYYEKGDFGNSKIEFEKAYWILERMGNLLDYEVIWGNLGNIFARERAFDHANTYFDMGLTINPKNDVLWNDKGNILYIMRDYEKAIKAYEQGISKNEKNPVLYQNLGVALSTIGQHEEALVNYNKAIELDPDYERAWHNRGKSYHDLGDYNDALKSYDNAIRLNEQSDAWLDRGDVLYLMERFEEALSSYDRTIKHFKDLPEAWIHKGVCLYALQRYSEAIMDFSYAIEIDDSIAVPYNLLGNTFASLGDFEKAKENYNIAIEKNPRYPRARFNLARTKAKLGEDALLAYEEAVKYTTPQRLNQLWFDEAVLYYNTLLNSDPDFLEAWKARGDLLMKIGRVTSAISSYKNAVERKPDEPQLHNLVGIALRKVKRLEESYEAFNEATKLDPEFAVAWNNKGNVLYLMGKFRDALECYNRAVELRSNYRSAIVNRHRCIIQLKSDIQVESVPLKSSIEDYMEAIEKYREQGYRVEILENLIQEGKPQSIKAGFEDFKDRVVMLKNAAEIMDELDIPEKKKEDMRAMMNNPLMVYRIMDVIDAAKRKEKSAIFKKLQKKSNGE